MSDFAIMDAARREGRRRAREICHQIEFAELDAVQHYLHACFVCNDEHRGAELDHEHQGRIGVGYVRLMVIGANQPGALEYCWRCSCIKSGWTNVPNDIRPDTCSDNQCVCHVAERAK